MRRGTSRADWPMLFGCRWTLAFGRGHISRWSMIATPANSPRPASGSQRSLLISPVNARLDELAGSSAIFRCYACSIDAVTEGAHQLAADPRQAPSVGTIHIFYAVYNGAPAPSNWGSIPHSNCRAQALLAVRTGARGAIASTQNEPYAATDGGDLYF